MSEEVIIVRMRQDQEVIKRWSGSAPFWEKHREIMRKMFAPITQALVEDGGICSGLSVLDVGTGPGEPALTVADVVGAKGKVTGIDPISGMVEAARRAADRLELRNVQFEVAFADQLPFAADTFDAVISRLGVMFFASPLDGAREMLRVLKPGKKLALAAWHLAERNPFHYAVARVIDRFVEPTPVAPDAPDAFRFGSRGKLLEVMKEAGGIAANERLLQFRIQAAISMEEFWKLRIEMSERLREKIGKLSEEKTREVSRDAMASMREYATDGGLSFPAEILIVSGRKG